MLKPSPRKAKRKIGIARQRTPSPAEQFVRMADREFSRPLETSEVLRREAFHLFCDPRAESELDEETLSNRRQEYFTKLGHRYRMTKGQIGSSRDEQLLHLLQIALLESSHWDVVNALMEQEDYWAYASRQEHLWLVSPFIGDPEVESFLSAQREVIEGFLLKKRVQSLRLHDGRKKPGTAELLAYRDATADDMTVDLLIFCARRIPQETLDSPVVKKIEMENNALRRKWRTCLREEKKRVEKAKKRDYRTGGGQKLSRLQVWLFKNWTNPHLPLCVLGLPDILNAAKLSPELQISPAAPQSKLRQGISESSIQKIQERAGLSRTRMPIAGNIQQGWPFSGFDINPKALPSAGPQ